MKKETHHISIATIKNPFQLFAFMFEEKPKTLITIIIITIFGILVLSTGIHWDGKVLRIDKKSIKVINTEQIKKDVKKEVEKL